MFRYLGLLLLSPLFVVAFALRLAFFLPFAVLFLLPMLIMRPRMILRAPRMFRYMMMAKRSGMGGCGGGRWDRRRLETVTEPVRF